MRAVNLLPPDRAAARAGGQPASTKTLLVAFGAVGALIVGGLSITVWTSNSSVSSSSKQLASLQTQILSIPTTTAPTGTTGSRQGDVVGLSNGRLAWDEFLTDLSKVMPEDVWIQSLAGTIPGSAANLAAAQAAAAAPIPGSSTTTTTTTTSTPAATAAVSTFTVTGFTYSQPSVARMLRRLELVPWLSGISLVSSSQATIGNDTVYQFQLKGAITSPGVPTP